MRLFGPLHISLLLGITAVGVLLVQIALRFAAAVRPLRLSLGCYLTANEVVWWVFRYSKEGFRPDNLPLQLCDVTVWTTVLACFTLVPWIVEFSYFAGLAGAGLALITPDLWSPWPSYPAIYFFLAHGGMVVAVAFLVFGRVAPLRDGALRRGFEMLLVYAAFVGLFDWVFKTNYMYLCTIPKENTLLSYFGPWPWYLFVSFALALILFWALWQAAKAARARPASVRSGRDPACWPRSGSDR